MPTPVIIERVRELQDQLAETQPDPAIAPHLEPVKQALATILIAPTEAAHYHSLGDLLLVAYVKVELAHPRLATAMQAVIDALATAGL